jgi:hypothetical protein
VHRGLRSARFAGESELDEAYVKNSLSAVLCFCLLSLLCISPGRAQQVQPQAPPAQPAAAQQPAPAAQPPDETPATQPRTIIQAPPPLPKYPDVQMPGETGYFAELIGWLPSGDPIVDKGHAADFTGLSYFHLPGTAKAAPSGEIGLALGLHNSLEISYFSTKASGTVTAPGALVLFGESYNKGDLLATSDKVQDLKISFAYLTWPYPVESRHFRLRTLYEVHWLNVSSNYDAPILSATPNSSGTLTSYATTGAKDFFSPALGFGMTEYASRNFRITLNVTGFYVPHHFALADGDLSASYRIGVVEIQVGAKGMFFKTSPQADFYFRGRPVGAFVGLRWCSE